ncbi:hypothetical protein L2E82_10603 [Cichorium intybus]|uniref:Uncharacterized protein n=1 Tax=Cichorium intybus TaxID=13427 RepID=A0ACB9GC25_CICIN|nr:hypothetical protein L2E82_10603 [Cichorium intybus]
MQRLPPPSPPYLFSIAPSHPFWCDFKGFYHLLAAKEPVQVSEVQLDLLLDFTSNKLVKEVSMFCDLHFKKHVE